MNVQVEGVAGQEAESGSFRWMGCERQARQVRSGRCRARADSQLRGRREYCGLPTAAKSRSIPRQTEGIPQRRPLMAWWFTERCVRRVRKEINDVVVHMNDSLSSFCQGAIAKWLQRQIRNLFLFEGAGSNPAGVGYLFTLFYIRSTEDKTELFIQIQTFEGLE